MELFPADNRKEQPRNGSGVNDRETVRKQYSTAEKLNTRISIHSKYSTNKQGFGNWIASHYDIRTGCPYWNSDAGPGICGPVSRR